MMGDSGGDRPALPRDDEREVSIDPAVLDYDHIFTAVSQPRRRYLLYALTLQSEWSVHGLAEWVAAWESYAEGTRSDSPDADRVYISLYHNHIPKLAAEDIVRFEENQEQVCVGPEAEHVFALLRGFTDRFRFYE